MQREPIRISTRVIGSSTVINGVALIHDLFREHGDLCFLLHYSNQHMAGTS